MNYVCARSSVYCRRSLGTRVPLPGIRAVPGIGMRYIPGGTAPVMIHVGPMIHRLMSDPQQSSVSTNMEDREKKKWGINLTGWPDCNPLTAGSDTRNSTTINIRTRSRCHSASCCPWMLTTSSG